MNSFLIRDALGWKLDVISVRHVINYEALNCSGMTEGLITRHSVFSHKLIPWSQTQVNNLFSAFLFLKLKAPSKPEAGVLSFKPLAIVLHRYIKKF